MVTFLQVLDGTATAASYGFSSAETITSCLTAFNNNFKGGTQPSSAAGSCQQPNLCSRTGTGGPGVPACSGVSGAAAPVTTCPSAAAAKSPPPPPPVVPSPPPKRSPPPKAQAPPPPATPPTCGSVQGAIDIKLPVGDVCTATFSLGNAGLTNTAPAKSTATTTKQRVSGCNGGWGSGKARKLHTFGFDADQSKPSFTISCPGTGYTAKAVSFDNFVIPNDNTGRFWFKGTCQDSQNSNNYYTFEVRSCVDQLLRVPTSSVRQHCCDGLQLTTTHPAALLFPGQWHRRLVWLQGRQLRHQAWCAGWLWRTVPGEDNKHSIWFEEPMLCAVWTQDCWQVPDGVDGCTH